MKILEIVMAGSGESSNLDACRSILEYQNIGYVVVYDTKRAVLLSRGKINPAFGLAIAAGEEVLLDCFDLMKWIERNGLRLL